MASTLSRADERLRPLRLTEAPVRGNDAFAEMYLRHRSLVTRLVAAPVAAPGLALDGVKSLLKRARRNFQRAYESAGASAEGFPALAWLASAVRRLRRQGARFVTDSRVWPALGALDAFWPALVAGVAVVLPLH